MKIMLYQDSKTKTRLDVYLAEKLNQSRSQIQKMIKSGLVLVNKKPARVHEFLKKNDKIKILEPAKVSVKTKVEDQHPVNINWLQKIKSKFSKKKSSTNFIAVPKVFTETKDYLIIEKPAGMLTHPTLKNETNTLVDWLLQKFPDIKGVGENPARPGIVHRLDKEVSGLMVIARNLDAFDWLKKQFKLRQVKKYYTALVHGKIEQDLGSIDFNIKRSKSGKYIALPKGSTDGKIAQTEFEVVQRFNNCTLVKINLLTGRTNQIRIHFNAFGHPLVGEKLYISNKLKQKSKINLDQVFLHASFLSFKDLTDEQQTFESPLPQKLQAVLISQK